MCFNVKDRIFCFQNYLLFFDNIKICHFTQNNHFSQEKIQKWTFIFREKSEDFIVKNLEAFRILKILFLSVSRLLH